MQENFNMQYQKAQTDTSDKYVTCEINPLLANVENMVSSE